MIFIYNCYGGTHSSSIAAAVHLGKLPVDKKPTRSDILGTDYFNKLSYRDMGKIIYRGTDVNGNRVYTVGRGRSKHLIPGLKELILLLSENYGLSEKVILSNMSPSVNLLMTIGGFFSRGLGLDFIGVPLLVKGTKKTFDIITRIVGKTKDAAESFKGPVLILENNDFEVNQLR